MFLPTVTHSRSSRSYELPAPKMKEEYIELLLGHRIARVARRDDSSGQGRSLLVEKARDGPQVGLDFGAPGAGSRVLKEGQRELLEPFAGSPSEYTAPQSRP